MARGILYPGSPASQMSGKLSNSSNFFTVPYEYYKDREFYQPIQPQNSGEIITTSDYFMNPDKSNNAKLDGQDVTSKLLVNKIHKALSLETSNTAMSEFRKQTMFYNRFKVPTTNDTFQKGFPHVFFVRPDLNLLNDDGTELRDQIAANANFTYAWRNSPDLIYQLVAKAPNKYHDWAMYLCNKAETFSLNDEYIETNTYGKTYTGWGVSYGKHSIQSKTAGDFSVTYTDDRNLHIYHLHKLWVEYISNLYRGSFSPRKEYVFKKIRDYTSAVYYVVTAEDGETIIFWSKYYGVFPTTIPSTQLSWGGNQPLGKQQIEIKYQYSFKEDFNPISLIEMNTNTYMRKTVPYMSTYDPNLGHSGDSWVGAPFVELVDERNSNQYGDSPYTFKLRFKDPDA